MNAEELLLKQRNYFNSNSTKDIGFRLDILKKLKLLLKSHEPEMFEAIYSDFNKSEYDTYTTELSFLYIELDLTIKKLKQWAKQKRVKMNLANFPGSCYLLPEPLGVCLIIGPWNYPYLLALSPLISAIAAGNTVIIKPSEIPKATSTVMAKLINENFPPELMRVVEGGIDKTTDLLNQKFDKIFFSGSTSVGKIVYQAAAKHLTPVTLELGGKSPAIITKSSFLKTAAKRLVWAKFLNAGQTCIAPDYILVDETVKDEFLKHVRFYIQKFDYKIENNNYVQIINERNFERLAALIDKTKLYYGGQTDSENRFITPTVLTDISFGDAIMEEEVFGPILPVISFTNLNDAIASIKSMPKPLACYIFTNDTADKNKLLGELSFGGGALNDALMHISNPYLPFGGVGQSGMGNYHGEAGFKTFSHFKSILDKSFWPDLNLKYPPNTTKKLIWIKRLIGF